MKPLRACFLGMMIFILTACGTIINPAGNQPQDTNTPEATLTSMATLTGTPSQTVTRIPGPTRRATLTSYYTLTHTPSPSLTLIPGTKLTKTATATITGTNTAFRQPILVRWTSTPAPFKCTTEATYPLWGTEFKPRTDFVAKWKVRNTGKNMWHAGDVLFGYVSGTKMHNISRVDKILDYTLYSKDSMEIQIHMKPPKEPGLYTAVWGFRKTNKKEFFCELSVTIRVVRK